MKSSRSITIASITILTLLSQNAANAQDGSALFASKGCLACHGIDANSPINDNIPKLAGQNKGYLVQQITDIGSGARNNGQTAQMKGIAAGLTEEEIEAIASYISSL